MSDHVFPSVRLALGLGLLLSLPCLGADAPPDPHPSKSPVGVAQKAAPDAAAAKRTKPARKVPATLTKLDVTVLDPSGKPFEGAFVAAYPVNAVAMFDGPRADKTRSGVTDRNGKATLDSLPPGPWSVSINARGFYAPTLPRVESSPLVVRLTKGESITGTVREGVEGRPIAGARVTPTWYSAPGDWEGTTSRNEAVTDARGAFRLDGLGPSPVSLSVGAVGYTGATRENVRPGTSVEVYLFAGPTLSGTVRDESDHPLKGVVVRVGADAWNGPLPSTRSDARGAFVIPGVTTGEYTLVARDGAHAPAISTAVVEPDSETRVVLTLAEGGFVTGRIVDVEGRPLAGRVRVDTFEGRGLPSFASDLMAATAQPSGVFFLGPVPTGTLGIQVSAPRHSTAHVEASVSSSGRTVDLEDVTLESGLAIHGRVRDKEGSPLAGVTVRASKERGGEPAADEAVSEDDGTFVVGGLAAGRYTVMGTLAGYATARAHAEPGGQPLELVMEIGGEITGRVADTQDLPVEGARLRAEPADTSGMMERFERSAWGSSDEGDGRFTLRDVAPGTYMLTAQASGSVEASLSGVQVTPGGTTDVGTLTLGSGSVIVGQVVDADGRGIPGATVEARRDMHSSTGRLSTQTDSSGAFQLRGAKAGKLSVVASHPAFAPSDTVIVDVDPENEPQPVRLVLLQGGRVEGRALHRDGSPFVGSRVAVLGSRAGSLPPLAAVDSDGTFVLEHLPPGHATINLMAFASSSPQIAMSPMGKILTGIDSRDVEVRDGETQTVDFLLRDVVVEGRVTRGGQPVPGVSVTVRPLQSMGAVMSWMGPGQRAPDAPSGPPPLSDMTTAEGAYELMVFAPGRASVDLRAEGQGLPGRDVTIPDVERFDLDFDLAETAVSGIIVDRETAQPLPEGSVSLTVAGKEDQWKGSARVGSDGRFSISADPGEYVLRAEAPSHAPASIPVSVSDGGLADVRVELERGLALSGHVVDEAGRPVSGMAVMASSPERRFGRMTDTLADGSFTLNGLGESPFTLEAGSVLAGYAIQPNVLAGGDSMTLVLRPGGTIALRVIDARGRPIEGAAIQITTVNGTSVTTLPREFRPTDRGGASQVSAPAGVVAFDVHKNELIGHGSVTVVANETAPQTVTVGPPANEKQ